MLGLVPTLSLPLCMGEGVFPHPLRVRVHWRLNTLEYRWGGGMEAARKRFLPGLFETFVVGLLIHDVQILIPNA